MPPMQCVFLLLFLYLYACAPATLLHPEPASGATSAAIAGADTSEGDTAVTVAAEESSGVQGSEGAGDAEDCTVGPSDPLPAPEALVPWPASTAAGVGAEEGVVVDVEEEQPEDAGVGTPRRRRRANPRTSGTAVHSTPGDSWFSSGPTARRLGRRDIEMASANLAALARESSEVLRQVDSASGGSASGAATGTASGSGDTGMSQCLVCHVAPSGVLLVHGGSAHMCVCGPCAQTPGLTHCPAPDCGAPIVARVPVTVGQGLAPPAVSPGPAGTLAGRGPGVARHPWAAR